MDNLKAQMLLSECTGVDIWPIELCQSKGIPESWVDELADCFESGFNSDLDTIFVAADERASTGAMRPTNQFHGVQDLDLARKLGEYLGVDTRSVAATAFGRRAEVKAIQEAAEEC